MGDLSFTAKEESATVAAIYAWHKAKGDAEPQRGYLGASIIGHDCDRYLWYTFRACVKRDFSGRMYRLFKTGNLAEARFIEELEGIGCEVVSHDEAGKQIEVLAIGGHFSGHLDGMALGVPEAPKSWHVCEFKTHNDKSFGALQKAGVQKSKPLHYAQMMVYMGLTKVDRALYLAMNKDTDEIYSERARYDAQAFKAIMSRAERIIASIQPPERCAGRSDDFRCKMCDARELCWHCGAVAVPLPAMGCRTCCHATPEMDGNARWSCDQGLLADENTCAEHLLIPGLVGFASVCDAGADWIEFQNDDDGAHWRHGNGDNDTWTTEELMRTPGPMVKAKVTALPLFMASCDNLPLPDRYPPEDTELVWHGPLAGLEKAIRDNVRDAVEGEQKHEDTDKTESWEFAGKFLAVIYKADQVAALWKGKE
jgi:hypothetical protein